MLSFTYKHSLRSLERSDLLKVTKRNGLYNCCKHFSSTDTETLEPVKLSYATYENTQSTSESSTPLVVMHGLFGSKGNWNSLCKVYQQKTNPTRKIIAIDSRNHGDSPHNDNHTYAHLAFDIKALLRDLGIKKASLLGHSMGGRAVMLFALKYPELVDKLIVADISPITTSPNLDTLPALFAAMENIDLPNNIPMSQARASVEKQLGEIINDKGLRAFLLTNLVQRNDGRYHWRINIPVLLKNFNSIARFPSTNDMKFDGPVLFLGGGSSDYIQKSDHPKILKLFPNAEIKYIEGAGHWLHSEKPAEFLKLTLDFLNRSSH